MSQVVLISTAEFALKSGPVRRILQRRLIDDLRTRVRRANLGTFDTNFGEGRIALEKVSDAVSVAEECSRVFGVAYAIPALKVATQEDEIASEALNQAASSLGRGETFAVRAKNPSKAGPAARDLEIKIGRLILDKFAGRGIRVNLDEPDHTIRIEVRGDSTFVSSRRFPGPSGLALGSQGRMLGLVLDRWASLAAFLSVMKRGAFVIPLRVRAQGSSIEGEGSAEALAQHMASSLPSGSVRLLDVDVERHWQDIGAGLEPGLSALLFRRFQFRVAEAIAPREKASAIVSGEMLGRDYGNLRSLRAATPHLSLAILRPLLTFQKDEALEPLRQLGLLGDNANLSPQVVFDTNASPREVSEIETKLGLSELAKSVSKSLEKKVVSAISTSS